MSQADRTVTSELTERWRRDLSLGVPHRWWVAERAGGIVGFVGICPSRDPIDPQLGEIDTIAIDQPHWRTGVGTMLMSISSESPRGRRLPRGDTLDGRKLRAWNLILRGYGMGLVMAGYEITAAKSASATT